MGFTQIEQLRDLIVSQFTLVSLPTFDLEIPFDVLQKIQPEIAYRTGCFL